MRIVSVLLLAAATMTGCATDNHRSANHPSFDCSGAGKGWDDCTKQADALCGAKGYDVISRNIDSTSGASSNSQMKRELVVACK